MMSDPNAATAIAELRERAARLESENAVLIELIQGFAHEVESAIRHPAADIIRRYRKGVAVLLSKQPGVVNMESNS